MARDVALWGLLCTLSSDMQNIWNARTQLYNPSSKEGGLWYKLDKCSDENTRVASQFVSTIATGAARAMASEEQAGKVGRWSLGVEVGGKLLDWLGSFMSVLLCRARTTIKQNPCPTWNSRDQFRSVLWVYMHVGMWSSIINGTYA